MTAQMLSCRKDGTKPHKAVKREIEIDREAPKITEVFMPNDLEDMNLQGRFRTAWPHRRVEGFNARPRKAPGFFYSLFVRFVFNYLRRWRGSPIAALKGGFPRQTGHDDHVSICF
ncbi:MAG TPA: hypothetical protein VJ646_09920 [Candidatus Binatia bacterium]|nr:hypothetical protein [Candidatus Binatia bacterium]